MKARKFTISFFLMIISIIYVSEIFAWDNKVTHKDLSKYAAENSVLDPSKRDYLKNLGYGAALTEKFSWNNRTQSALLWLREGAEFEDAGGNFNAFLGLGRFNNHFHNPLKPWASAGLSDLGYIGESAIFWAQYGSWQASYTEGDWSWKKIRDCYYLALTSKNDVERQANFAQTFRGLGHQMHLIQDMSVPAHVRNDAHPEDSILGSSPITGDYYLETWAKKNSGLINSFASSPVFPSVDLNISRNGLAPISQFIDAEQYNANVIPGKSLSWGLSEYTNSNFASDDTIFTENFNNNDKHYFPYPRYIDQNQCYEQLDLTYGLNKKRTYWKKKCLGEPVDHFVIVGPLFKYLPTWGLQRMELKFDSITHYDYASKLIPRAVGYSAGLLNYFFRGDIDIIPDGSGHVIVNNSEEDMSGTFELWYDKKNDERIKVWSGYFGIGKKSSGYNKSANVTFMPPQDARDRGKYLLVFKGRMGNEQEAVAGKEVVQPRTITLCDKEWDTLALKVIIKGDIEIEPYDMEVRASRCNYADTISVSRNFTSYSTGGNVSWTEAFDSTTTQEILVCAGSFCAQPSLHSCTGTGSVEYLGTAPYEVSREIHESSLKLGSIVIDNATVETNRFGEYSSEANYQIVKRVSDSNCKDYLICESHCSPIFGCMDQKTTLRVSGKDSLGRSRNGKFCYSYCCSTFSNYHEVPIFTSNSSTEGTMLGRVMGYGAKNTNDIVLMGYEKTTKSDFSKSFSTPGYANNRYDNKFLSHDQIEHLLYFKIGNLIHTIGLESFQDETSASFEADPFRETGISVNNSNTMQRGTRVANFSLHIDDAGEIMVYSYMKYNVDYAYWWDQLANNGAGEEKVIGTRTDDPSNFITRVLGVINISNPRLPAGYRKEFIIDENLLSPLWRNYDVRDEGTVGILSNI